ncbi:MAG TPA: enoyl-CoA hydratase/isomerase family protein [Acidimicrobiales bacterium]|nr:enoyl-CoA hydratase/isomerase family protein [Acidimicrobiales bacterium]
MGHIRYEVSDRVATVTIDRPEKRNAMTWATLHEFDEAIRRAGSDDGVGAVVVTGAGGAFCAGTDLTDLAGTPEDERSRRGREGAEGRAPWPIVACPKPVVAAVDGAAVGMGAEFATQCDVRVASTRARFGWIFVLRGLVSDTGAGTYLLPRLVGPTAAMRLLFSGEIIDAAEAQRLGFVTAVVEPDDLPAAAETEARRYLDASPFALRRTKELVYGGMFRPVDEHLRETARLLEQCFHSEDHREGVAAFLERRPAAFTGR